MERKLFVDADKYHVVNTQDVEPILELNKAQRGLDQKADWGRHIATVPNVILLQWFYEEQNKGNRDLQMYTPEFDQIIARKLQDPDWAYLRTDKPKLQAGWSAGLVM